MPAVKFDPPEAFMEAVRLSDAQDVRELAGGAFSLDIEHLSDEQLARLLEILENEAYDPHLYEWYTELVHEILRRFRCEKDRRESLGKYLDIIEMNSEELDRRELLGDLPKLLRRYGNWVRDDVGLAALVEGQPKSYLAAKRGNEAYVAALGSRIRKLEELLPAVKFFDTSNARDRKPRHTSVLSCTLTYKQRNVTLYDAYMVRLSRDINLFLALLRKAFGECYMLRAFESHKSGYPHIHMIIVFTRARFRTFWQPFRNPKPGQKRKGAWRVVGHTAITSLWEEFPGVPSKGIRGFCDVMAVSSIEGVMDIPEDPDPNSLPLMHSVKYMLKDYRETDYDEDHKSGYLQTAILWATRKRAFSFSTSRDGRNLFLEAVGGHAARLDWTVKANSNPDLLEDLENSSAFQFLGHFHYFDIELKTRWKPPPGLSCKIPREVMPFFSGRPAHWIDPDTSLSGQRGLFLAVAQGAAAEDSITSAFLVSDGITS